MKKKITDTIFGQTPLPEDWKNDLIPSHISLLSELNEFESQNVEKAVQKYLFGKKKFDLTHPEVINRLHLDTMKFGNGLENIEIEI